MIHEYAIDPRVLATWASNQRDYAEFLREYGVGTPRIISSFPKCRVAKFRSYLLQRGPADSNSLVTQRYQEMVVKLVGELVLRESDETPGADWCEFARIENNRLPFGAVLSSEVVDTEKSMTLESMYLSGSLWLHPRQTIIERTLIGFTLVVRDFLRLASNQVVVVDTYGWTREAIVIMQYIVNIVCEGRVNGRLPSITLYYKTKRDGGSPEAEYVKREIVKGLNNFDPGSLHVVELGEVDGSDVFHNRCILTEHGGVITGHGIGVSNETSHTDEILLMESAVYQKKWQQFVEDNRYKIITQSI